MDLGTHASHEEFIKKFKKWHKDSGAGIEEIKKGVAEATPDLEGMNIRS